MKKITLIIGILVIAFSLKAQSPEAYIKAMSNGLSGLGKAQTYEDLQKVAGQFERIAANAKSEWEPQYYTALTFINMSLRVQEISQKDALTSKAQGFIDRAIEIEPNHSEIVALQGFKYMIELSADPDTRGQMLSPKAMQFLGQALKIDPENPRANIFMAQMEFGMAQFFGSPTDRACTRAQKALDLFNAQPAKASFEPSWGKDTAEEMTQQCGK